MSEANKLRSRIEELTEDLKIARNWCEELDMQIEELTIKLQLLERPNYYSIEEE